MQVVSRPVKDHCVEEVVLYKYGPWGLLEPTDEKRVSAFIRATSRSPLERNLHAQLKA